MNTPAHLLLAAGVFAKPDSPKITTTAIIGGLLPDISLYLMAAYSLFINGHGPDYVFNVQYFSDSWQQIFAIDNSFILWGIFLGFALWQRNGWLIALTGGAILHLCLDFPLHHHDARQHFWPISNWVFHSPFSYWDSNHYGTVISALEQTFVVVIWVVLWRRFTSTKMRIFFTSLAFIELAPILIFGMMF
jgi:hypothetical protein